MPKAPANIEQFNLIALHVFQRLYDAFPCPIELDYLPTGADAIAAAPKEFQDRTDHFGYYFEIVPYVITWLAEEGFLRHTPDPNLTASSWSGKVYDARLSMKGLVILGSVPTAVRSQTKKKPVIDEVRGLLKKGAAGAASEAGEQLILHVFNAAMSMG